MITQGPDCNRDPSSSTRFLSTGGHGQHIQSGSGAPAPQGPHHRRQDGRGSLHLWPQPCAQRHGRPSHPHHRSGQSGPRASSVAPTRSNLSNLTSPSGAAPARRAGQRVSNPSRDLVLARREALSRGGKRANTSKDRSRADVVHQTPRQAAPSAEAKCKCQERKPEHRSGGRSRQPRRCGPEPQCSALRQWRRSPGAAQGQRPAQPQPGPGAGPP